MNRTEIEDFVRRGLGCGCPDEVFDRIALGKVETGPAGTVHTRLVIGERLLIYVMTGAGHPDPAQDVAVLAARGLAERNQAGYNRFRLVAVLEPGSREADRASAAFTKVIAGDASANLHCLDAATVPQSLMPAGTAQEPAA